MTTADRHGSRGQEFPSPVHIHAWDFAQTIGEDYHTEHAATFYEGGLVFRGRTPGDEDPWQTTLHYFRPRWPRGQREVDHMEGE